MAGTAGKYHINAKGEAEKCTATKKPCPYGATGHYDTPGEAKTAMEKIWKEKVLGETGSGSPKLSKKLDKKNQDESKRKPQNKNERRRLANEYIAARNAAMEKIDSRYGNDNGKLKAALNAAIDRHALGPRELLAEVNENQLKAANQLGNESDRRFNDPYSPELKERAQDRNRINQVFSEEGVVEPVDGVQMADIYNRWIGSSSDDSEIGIAPVQTMNWTVEETDYYVDVTVTDDDLIRAGVNKNSLGTSNVDLSDPVLYKNVRHMQSAIQGQNSDGYGEDLSYYDGHKDVSVVMDWTPKLSSITRMSIPGVDKPAWRVSFHGKTEIDDWEDDEDDDYEDEDDDNWFN